ncbi:MAG: alpha/beta hydrolase [Rubrivivax sp.]|nr:alpha/beta hydrolase [Rubrivivax sp.]
MKQPPEWYDQQYNARAGIPDAAAIVRSWADRSAATRARGRCVLDVPYTEAGASDPSERLDLFLPDAAPAGGGLAPVLLHIHGGYWRALHKEDQSFVAEAYTAAGALVVVPNYALCPQVSIAHIVMQMVQAIAWTWRHAPRYGGDRSRIVVTGHSAGGHLAAMMLACDWPAFAPDLPAGLVGTAVPVSGLFDLEPLRHAPFLAPDIGLTRAEAQRLSPARLPAPRSGRAQLLAFVGALESPEFHRQGERIRRAWGDAVVPVCEPVPGCHHLSVLHALGDPATRLNRAVRGALGLPGADGSGAD